MNIVFIDDQPQIKVQEAINYLKDNKLVFKYLNFISSDNSIKYIMNNLSSIDLIVLDMGLPKYDYDNLTYNKYEGLYIMKQVLNKTKNIPIIINSTTVINSNYYKTEKEYLNTFRPAIIEHVEKLTGFYLLEFIKSYLDNKIEFQ